MTMWKRLTTALAVVGAVTLGCASVASASGAAKPDDVARILAGMKPSDGSPLESIAKDAAFQRNATRLDTSWENLDKRQLSKIRDWSRANLTKRQSTAFYLFSGPDFLYVNAFLPDAKTYVFAGLEPVGRLPDLASMPRGTVSGLFEEVNASINTVMTYSFFITKEMQDKLRTGALRGTLPIIAVFMARSGKTISDVTYVSIDADGNEQPLANPDVAGPANGVKITFASPGGKPQTLYYFSTNLHNSGAKSTGFLKFCAKLGPGDSFVKSASYLMHDNNFSVARDFLLENSATLTQDDSGIPLRFFDTAKWDLKPFGNYVGPISIFKGNNQPKLKELFTKAKAPKIDFGVGYRWRPNETNVVLTVKK